MSDLQDLTNESMQDNDFTREYEALQPEMDRKRAILDGKIESDKVQANCFDKQ